MQNISRAALKHLEGKGKIIRLHIDKAMLMKLGASFIVGEGETCRSPVMGFWRNDPPKFHCKIFHAVADAKLSSGCDEPLELLLVSAFRTLLLLLACFSHTATQW